MSDDSIGYMSPFDFASKIDWQGGVMSALDYGLKHDELDPNDPASAADNLAAHARELYEMEPYVLLIYRNGDEGDDDLRCSISAGGGISTEEEIGAALRLAVSSLPDAPTIEIRRPHDDVLQVVIDGEVVAEANHDEHGWDGMDAVEKTALAVARALGVDLGEGEPGEARDAT